MRRSQRPLSVRKEIGRSRGDNFLLPPTPRVADTSDDEDINASSVADTDSLVS